MKKESLKMNFEKLKSRERPKKKMQSRLEVAHSQVKMTSIHFLRGRSLPTHRTY